MLNVSEHQNTFNGWPVAQREEAVFLCYLVEPAKKKKVVSF